MHTVYPKATTGVGGGWGRRGIANKPVAEIKWNTKKKTKINSSTKQQEKYKRAEKNKEKMGEIQNKQDRIKRQPHHYIKC